MSSEPNTKRVNSARDLAVYKLAYELAMEIFELSKRFPPEEKFALTTQIRRSSRSVCLNLREAWAKRRYEAHFISKLTDSDGENSETDSSLDFARDCGYLSADGHPGFGNQMRKGRADARTNDEEVALVLDCRMVKSDIRLPISDFW
jgi:four helix bundle protein